MTDDLDNLGLASAANFTVQSVAVVETTTDELPTPTLVTNAVRPEVVARERRERQFGVTDEAANGVRVHGQEEGDEEVVSVPKGLEGLLSDLRVRCCVHEQHAEQHDVTSDATGLRVMDLQGKLRTNLADFDVEEAAT